MRSLPYGDDPQTMLRALRTFVALLDYRVNGEVDDDDDEQGQDGNLVLPHGLTIDRVVLSLLEHEETHGDGDDDEDLFHDLRSSLSALLGGQVSW